MTFDKTKALITDTGTSVFRRYSVDTKIIDGYSGVFARAEKTTIMYNKQYLKEATGEDYNYTSQVDIPNRVQDTFDKFIYDITGYSPFNFGFEDTQQTDKYGYVSLDAVTSYVRTSTASTNQRTVENLQVYTEGMVSEPDTISITARIDIYNSNKQELLYTLHKEKIPIQLYTAKVNPDGIINEVLYDDREQKMFIITDYTVTDVSSMNTVDVSLSLSEVVTFDVSEEVVSIVAKDTIVLENDKDDNKDSDTVDGDQSELKDVYGVIEPNSDPNTLNADTKKIIEEKS